MFDKLKQAVRSLTPAAPVVDPQSFHDPLALRTEWTALSPGGANFRTHRLDRSDPYCWRFRPSIGAILFGLVFVGLGMCGLGAGFLNPVVQWIPGLFGLVFTSVGAWLVWSVLTPIRFDKQRGYFNKGRTNPEATFDRSKLKDHTPLENIHALQLLAERVTSSKGASYLSYELNLVLNDGSRIHVVDHGGGKRLRSEAAELASFLGKPLWDASC